MSIFAKIEEAIEQLQQGGMIILVDDENRESEGDLVVAAEKISPATVNFMSREACGMMCLALSDQIVKQLELSRMPVRHQAPHQAAFTESIDAVQGITTGISTFDRAHTILTAVNPSSIPSDIATPGHVFPLVARSGGVLERAGHTEGSVDLVMLAGFRPAAVICEVLQKDGNSARIPYLIEFAITHHLPLVAINDLIAFRHAQSK